SRSHFARAAHGIRPPRGVYTHIAGCDLVRDAQGAWKVLEDNVRTPSGISYMLENRLAMTRLIPSLFAHHRVRPIDQYPAVLHAALRSVAPVADGAATIVVWTPGPANSAYFEHTFLARQMGVELVEASDLVVRDDVCYMRTTSGLARANAIGTGVADDKAVYCYVPAMIRFYLGEEPLLENVTTYLLDDPEQLEAALARIDALVFKPTGESGGKGVVIGPDTDERRLIELAATVRSEPTHWIAQEVVRLSTVPTVCADGTLAPRHVDLRPFAIFGEEIRIVPGGLTRVALEPGSLIVNSSRGGGSKDTWVLQDDEEPELEPALATAFTPPTL